MKQYQAVMHWKLGLGHMGKYFNGENPLPDKNEIATKDSWKTEPMLWKSFVEDTYQRPRKITGLCTVMMNISVTIAVGLACVLLRLTILESMTTGL